MLESITELTSAPNLIRTRFDNVPAGSFHQVHIEGSETNLDRDVFQFYFATEITPGSCVPGTYAEIPDAIISSSTETSKDYVFGDATIVGTVFIQVRDVGNGNGNDTLRIDQLTIGTVP